MKKRLSLFLAILFSTTLCYSAPDTTMSIPNSFSPNTTISSSQVNANNNEITTQYNSHSHADITSLGTVSSGFWAGTVITVPYGGTGASTLTDGGILIGNGTSAIQALGVATNGQVPIGDGTTDPTLATLTGTADEVDVTNGAGTITIGLVNPLAVTKGGTGATTFAGAALARIKTGTYTGNAAATKAITGVGFQPKAVQIYPQSQTVGYRWWWKTDQDGTYAASDTDSSNVKYLTDHIISLDADGFTIGDGTGDDNRLNANGVVYTYICWGQNYQTH